MSPENADGGWGIEISFGRANLHAPVASRHSKSPGAKGLLTQHVLDSVRTDKHITMSRSIVRRSVVTRDSQIAHRAFDAHGALTASKNKEESP